MTTHIIPAADHHSQAWVAMAQELWPQSSAAALQQEFSNIQSSSRKCIFLSSHENQPTGFIYLSTREDHVEGVSHYPVAYIEGLYVDPQSRYYHVATALVREGEAWARQQGCKQLASDAELYNHGSHIFHNKVGFQEVNRIICYAKTLH